MINICERCGAYRPDKQIDLDRSEALCPECGHRHPFLRLPLLVVSGASGCGKTTVARRVVPAVRDIAVALDGDILWGPHFEKEGAASFFETWLRICKNVGQGGRPVVCFGAGFGPPGNLSSCIERRYFSTLHYLALVCDEEVQAQRLRSRPAWRHSAEQAYLLEHAKFNAWFKEQGPEQDPPIALVDTSTESVAATTTRVVEWVRARLAR